MKNKLYDVLIIGAGPGGLYAAYELLQRSKGLKIGVFEKGRSLENRRCPIDGKKVKSCVHCKTCSIMSGFGGAGAFSDGKYNITNDFGGTLYKFIGREEATELMEYVDSVNMKHGGEGTKLYSTANSEFKRICIQNNLHLLDASVRHLGTDINYRVLENLYNELKNDVDFHFDCEVEKIELLTDEATTATRAAAESPSAEAALRADATRTDLGAGENTAEAPNAKNVSYLIRTADGDFSGKKCIISVGRSGSKWLEKACEDLSIPTLSSRVDIGVRVELPYLIFSHITDELYESKIMYQTKQYQDRVRTFCMNPKGIVVAENTNGIVTVNGHSYEDPEKQTDKTNFALLVSKHFTEPFKDSNGYGESIARLSNMLGGGVIVQRFGDLIRGQRTNDERLEKNFMQPSLSATPGDLSLVMPKRIMDGLIEMIYQLDRIAPGTAGDDTLLYGVEVKFYNMQVDLDEKLETCHKGLYVIGDGSGVTHSLSHASASGVYVARTIASESA